MMRNQRTLERMRKIYYPTGEEENLDWMGYPITEENHPSYHHIVKVEELLRMRRCINPCVPNGAYLGKKSHEKLHHIEILDYELYLCWNYLFQLINRMKCYPLPDVWEMVKSLQKKTEELLQKSEEELHQMKKTNIKKKREYE